MPCRLRSDQETRTSNGARTPCPRRLPDRTQDLLGAAVAQDRFRDGLIGTPFPRAPGSAHPAHRPSRWRAGEPGQSVIPRSRAELLQNIGPDLTGGAILEGNECSHGVGTEAGGLRRPTCLHCGSRGVLGRVSPGRSAILSRAARLANAPRWRRQLGRIHDELGGGDPDALWKALVDVDFLVCAMEDAARWQLDAASHRAIVDRASRV